MTAANASWLTGQGNHASRVNDRWRSAGDGDAHEVELTDDH